MAIGGAAEELADRFQREIDSQGRRIMKLTLSSTPTGGVYAAGSCDAIK